MNPFAQSAAYFDDDQLRQIIFVDKYSRFRYDLPRFDDDFVLGRREAWVETVDRAASFLRELSQNRLSPQDYDFIHRMILEMRAMPSMRLLAMAGDAARRNNICLFNCTHLTMDDPRAFGEVMLLSMNGCGVGYSVEKEVVAQLPVVPRQTGRHRGTHYVGDSTEGWVVALMELVDAMYHGEDIDFNFDFVRPAGAILRTKGGRASGPEPLKRALAQIRQIFLAAQGRRLIPFEVHRINCLTASASMSGGVRRSALIALFSPSDQKMLTCKSGFGWWDVYPELAYANNTVVFGNSLPDAEIEAILRQMDANKTGEPGLFNRDGVNANLPVRRSPHPLLGINPCGELPLKPMQTCNLSSAVCREADDFNELAKKVRAATIIGTIQSMADYFPGLRPEWRQNQISERLLGVDLNGQLDCPLVQKPWVQEELKQIAIETNERYARLLGINQAAAVTTVKPSGNSGMMLGASSGLHARWSPFYIRHIRFNRHSPVRRLLEAHGAPMYPETGQEPETADTWVVPFPVKSPERSIFRKDRTALQQLDYWLQVRTHWTEHQPSVTITYQPHELDDIIDWVKGHRDLVAGLSFLPADDHTYPLAPYVEIDKEEYERRAAEFPRIDFSRLVEFEDEDLTVSSREIACAAGVCEL